MSDISAYMQAMSSVHGLELEIFIGNLGASVGSLLCQIIAAKHITADSPTPLYAQVSGVFPCAQHATWEGFLYAGLMSLENQISEEWYRQLGLEECIA